MAVAWTLEYAGVTKSLVAWGIRRPRLTFRSLDIDELTFEMPRANVLAAPTFPAGAELILRRDGVGWFRGKVVRAGATGSARGEADGYVVHNAWASLARTVYQQQWCVSTGPQFTPRVVLGQNIFGQKISIGRQITEILTYALTKGIIVAPGALPVLTKCWKEEVRDMTCAGAIRNVLRLLPNVVGWCDYSAGVPVFNAQENTFLASVTIDATAGNLVADLSGLTPRADLVPSGVTFIYQGTVAGTGGKTLTTLTRDAVGVTDTEGSIVALVELAPDDTVPAGAATAYFAALQVTPYEGQIRTLEQECSGTLRPGKVVNISNGRAEWAAMRAVVQIVSEDLYSGETVAQLGAPEHLAPQDFIAQQQIARKRATTTQFPVVQPCLIADPAGSQGDPETGVAPDTIANPDAGVDPSAKDAVEKFKKVQAITDPASQGMRTVDLSICTDGSESTIKVYTPSA